MAANRRLCKQKADTPRNVARTSHAALFLKQAKADHILEDDLVRMLRPFPRNTQGRACSKTPDYTISSLAHASTPP